MLIYGDCIIQVEFQVQEEPMDLMKKDVYIKEIKICRDPEFCEELLHNKNTEFFEKFK